ncbi:NYN domain-containing protein [Actinocatenispora comari]|uniref:NYN domain-containing protein n=1 Tax=Actinocatenispora comari TaxID=2807577 RepID=UPI001A9233D7|nr:NYN domain-containing protein [Actinocatenispora comari]
MRAEEFRRSGFRVVAEPLLQLLRQRVEQTVLEAQLLRIYWYDAAPDQVHTVEQREIAALAGVKVRLGWLTPQGQKGVDSLLSGDLAKLADRQSIDHAIVLTGDADMLTAVDDAQSMGVQVHLWGIDPVYGVNQSMRLVWEADSHTTFDAHAFADVYTRRPLRHSGMRTGQPIPASATPPSTPTEQMPTPADLTHLRRPPEPVSAQLAVDRSVRPSLPGPVPAASDISETERHELTEVGEWVAQVWLVERGRDNLSELLPGPILPPVINHELITKVEQHLQRPLRGESNEPRRRLVRDGFWARLIREFGHLGGENPPSR